MEFEVFLLAINIRLPGKEFEKMLHVFVDLLIKGDAHTSQL
jgi:hypothetical protein